MRAASGRRWRSGSASGSPGGAARGARAGTVWAGLAAFFSKMAVVTFGGAYAVLSYVAQQAVEVHGWLTGPQMIDGLGLAETTPGPLILVLQFVGFLAAWGWQDRSIRCSPERWALLTLWVVFAPSLPFHLRGRAPYAEALRGRPGRRRRSPGHGGGGRGDPQSRALVRDACAGARHDRG